MEYSNITLVNWIVGMGSNAVCLSPSNLVLAVKDEMKKALSMYET